MSACRAVVRICNLRQPDMHMPAAIGLANRVLLGHGLGCLLQRSRAKQGCSDDTRGLLDNRSTSGVLLPGVATAACLAMHCARCPVYWAYALLICCTCSFVCSVITLYFLAQDRHA
jgi:hypothetical protein